MKQTLSTIVLFLVITISSTFRANAQNENATDKNLKPALKTYLIERDIPGAGQLTAADLKGISQKSCSVIKEMGPEILWKQSYVTGNKVYCVYQAENEMLIREHGKKGGFPITSITEIKETISPKTAN